MYLVGTYSRNPIIRLSVIRIRLSELPTGSGCNVHCEDSEKISENYEETEK